MTFWAPGVGSETATVSDANGCGSVKVTGRDIQGSDRLSVILISLVPDAEGFANPSNLKVARW